jgi:putative ABC transport system ATP-binding protein
MARALVGRPSLILADEPTGALDSKTGKEILALLKRVNADEGVTVVVITHDLGLAAQCTRRVEIRDGLLGKVT